ncbi:MAG: hypothetical protein AAFX62_18485 [Pseudomonadota bacterium]
MTTTQAKAGRGGGVRTDKATLAVMRTTRKTLAALLGQLEILMDEDLMAGGPKDNTERLKTVQTLINTAHKSLQTVQEIEGKLSGDAPGRLPDPPVLNLEEARAEIERRLARLAA